MTRRTNARIAGLTFLVYFVAGIGSMLLSGRASATSLLSLVTSVCALLLGVTLYALTRHVDRDLALLALAFRIIEAMPGEGAIYFAAGSTLFCWLLLRGRLIPVALAWLGVGASALLLVILPLQRAGLFGGAMSWASTMTWFVWLPALVFELTFAVWLLVRGVAAAPLEQPA
jgi:hypothetical protein